MFQVIPFEATTLNWWFDQIDNVDLNPPYQRAGHLWSDSDKTFLIDSILNGYDIPKLYVADFTFFPSKIQQKDFQYAVIDGKQRLETMFEFFEGKIVLDKNFEWIEDPSLSLAGLSYIDLKRNYQKVARKFENFNLSVMRVITDDESRINDLFVRLNRSKPLTGAEVRNAMGGAVPRLIAGISEHTFFKEKTKSKTNRGEAKNVAAKLLLIEFRGRLVDTKKTKLDRFVDEGMNAEAQQTDFERAADRVHMVLNELNSIFVNQDPLLKSQGPIPVYYWFARSLDASYIGRMRQFLVSFEVERRKNQTKTSSNAANKNGSLDDQKNDDVDTELLSYDILDRSTNDEGSLSGRFNILQRRFTLFSRE